MAVAGDPETPVAGLVDTLKYDPAIAGRILRAANAHSGEYPRRISAIPNAIDFLGRDRVCALLLLSRHFAGETGGALPPFFAPERFWRHSVLVALFAASIGRHLKRYAAVDEEELFTGGLLHDIGKIALAVGGGTSLETARLRSMAESLPFHSAEDREPHAMVGALLANAWSLPPELQQACGGHHEPAVAGCFVSVIHFADIMAHLVGYPVFDGEATPPVDPAALAAFPLPPERLKLIAADGLLTLGNLEQRFGLAGRPGTAG